MTLVKKSVAKSLLGIVAAGGLLLTGCTPPGNVAAAYGNERLSEADFQARLASCREAGHQAGENPADILAVAGLGMLIRQGHPLFQGARASDAEVDKIVDESGIKQFAGCAEHARDLAMFNMTFPEVAAETPDENRALLNEMIGAAEYNPRLGKPFVDEQGMLNLMSGSLSTPVGP